MTTADRSPRGLYGLMASFSSPDDLIRAARAAHRAGYRRIDGYSPVPVEGLAEALGVRPTRLPLGVFVAGVLGALSGYGLQYYCAVIAYPVNVGGRPLHSWPAFIPVTFEMTVLFASLAAVLGMLALNGLPMPYHPVFNVPEFALAGRDRFFLTIEAADPLFERTRTAEFLRRQNPLAVSEVSP